jgi:hypothetical protein
MKVFNKSIAKVQLKVASKDLNYKQGILVVSSSGGAALEEDGTPWLQEDGTPVYQEDDNI